MEQNIMNPEDVVLDFIENVGTVVTDTETDVQYIVRGKETFNFNLIDKMIATRYNDITGLELKMVSGISDLIEIASVDNVF